MLQRRAPAGHHGTVRGEFVCLFTIAYTWTLRSFVPSRIEGGHLILDEPKLAPTQNKSRALAEKMFHLTELEEPDLKGTIYIIRSKCGTMSIKKHTSNTWDVSDLGLLRAPCSDLELPFVTGGDFHYAPSAFDTGQRHNGLEF